MMYMEYFNYIVGLGTVGLFLATLYHVYASRKPEYIHTLPQYGARILLAVSALAVLGSLVYSEIFNFIPCPLCWWQRVFMFPLPILLAVALYKSHTAVYSYIYALSGIGFAISLYQIILQIGLFGEASPFCEPGSFESCSIITLDVFGFITIPIMAGVSFLYMMVLSRACMRIS